MASAAGTSPIRKPLTGVRGIEMPKTVHVFTRPQLALSFFFYLTARSSFSFLFLIINRLYFSVIKSQKFEWDNNVFLKRIYSNISFSLLLIKNICTDQSRSAHNVRTGRHVLARHRSGSFRPIDGGQQAVSCCATPGVRKGMNVPPICCSK